LLALAKKAGAQPVHVWALLNAGILKDAWSLTVIGALKSMDWISKSCGTVLRAKSNHDAMKLWSKLRRQGETY
jgi:hypothetical protein